MGTFTPYTYKISDFHQLKNYNGSELDAYLYETFTMLNKPVKRNVYKISLAQILHYFIDFGIGFNSVCSTNVTSIQTFRTTRYMNRH